MAISLGTALIGGSLLGIGGNILAADATKDASRDASAATLQATRESNALAEDIYNRNRGALEPWMVRGNMAGDAYMELLGFGGETGGRGYGVAPALPAPAPSPAGRGPTGALSSSLVPAARNSGIGPSAFNRAQNRVALEYLGSQQGFAPRSAPQGALATVGAGAMPSGAGGAVTARPTAKSAFDRYLESTGYQFRLGEGLDAINSGYAAKGLLESGAAQKALLRYGQDYGSGEFGKYMALLNNQQGMGLSGASALAGVGQNYAGLVTSNNMAAGDARANAALARGSANANMWQGIAGGVGNILGSSWAW